MNTIQREADAFGEGAGTTASSDSETAPQSGGWPHYLAASLVFAVGLAALLGSLDLGYWEKGPGPGFFPFWIGLVLMLLSAVWAAQVLTGRAGLPSATVMRGKRDVVLTLVGLGSAVLLLDIIGYELSMLLLVLFQLQVVSHRRWLESVIFALIAGPGVYALFAYVLQVFLPTASIGFLTNLGL